ncbi:MAG: hypothetical protein C4555_03600 [Dehalococcoidia bacterium]|nr:MAG: hypothetical protein C4555_03600 [Dehalococcoidia bacterium]
MESALLLIEQIIREHGTYLEKLETMERVTNDAEALYSLKQSQEEFVPGRLDQKAILEKLKELVGLVSEGLEAHFEREETALVTAFKKAGDAKLIAAFNTLLLEHKDLRDRFALTRERLRHLAGGEMSRHIWEASAHDMRAHINHTRKLLAAHAGVEEELLGDLRRLLSGGR